MKIKTTIETPGLFPDSGAKSHAHGLFVAALQEEYSSRADMLVKRLDTFCAMPSPRNWRLYLSRKSTFDLIQMFATIANSLTAEATLLDMLNACTGYLDDVLNEHERMLGMEAGDSNPTADSLPVLGIAARNAQRDGAFEAQHLLDTLQVRLAVQAQES
jgi:hypothetical protein